MHLDRVIGVIRVKWVIISLKMMMCKVLLIEIGQDSRAIGADTNGQGYQGYQGYLYIYLKRPHVSIHGYVWPC